MIDKAKSILDCLNISIACKEGNMKMLRKGSMLIRLPNWAFNEPYIEKVLVKNSEEQIVDLKISDFYGNKQYNISCSNHISSETLKTLIRGVMSLDESSKIRVLFKGCELIDIQHLYEHGLKNKSIIQVVIQKEE